METLGRRKESAGGVVERDVRHTRLVVLGYLGRPGLEHGTLRIAHCCETRGQTRLREERSVEIREFVPLHEHEGRRRRDR